MNKSIFFGILGLIAGAILIVLSIVIIRGDFTKLNSKNAGSKYNKFEYECSGSIDEIDIKELSETIEIVVKNVDRPAIEYWCREGQEDKAEITEKGGKLTFTRSHENISFNIGFNFDDTHTILTLPEDYQGPMSISTNSGSIKADEIKNKDVLYLKATSGSIKAGNIEATELTVKANSGSISLKDVKCSGNVEIGNTSGSITLESISADGDLKAENNSGSIKMTDIACGDLSAKNASGGASITNAECGKLDGECNSGSLHLTSVNAQSINGKTTSGSIKIDGIAADEIVLKAKSGGVKGSIKGSESDYSILCSTGSGSSNLDSKRDGDKSLDVTTTSGSVKITFDK